MNSYQRIVKSSAEELTYQISEMVLLDDWTVLSDRSVD